MRVSDGVELMRRGRWSDQRQTREVRKALLGGLLLVYQQRSRDRWSRHLEWLGQTVQNRSVIGTEVMSEVGF